MHESVISLLSGEETFAFEFVFLFLAMDIWRLLQGSYAERKEWNDFTWRQKEDGK